MTKRNNRHQSLVVIDAGFQMTQPLEYTQSGLHVIYSLSRPLSLHA